MVVLSLVAAALAMLGAVAAGTLAHELLHAAVLRAAGIACELHLGGAPDQRAATETRQLAGLGGALAAVSLLEVPENPLPLRAASLAPLALALPFLLVPAGVVADPFAGGAVSLQAALLGWLACALPSPSDFAVAFHAEELVARDELAA